MRVELDLPLEISDICNRLNAKTPIKSNYTIRAICTDTRECKPDDLFIALSGENSSGEKYINDALKKQCTIISSSERPDVIYVNDTTSALLSIAQMYKGIIKPKWTIAVTGSVGKSTTLKFLSKILRTKFKVHSTKGNFNNHLGLPLTVLSMPSSTEVLLVELGMNHRGEISRLSKCVCPDIAIITSVGTAHIGNLGSRKEIAQAKLEILDGMKDGRLIVPENEPLLSSINGAYYVGRNSSLSHFSLDNGPNNSFVFRSMRTKIDNLNFLNNSEHLLTDLLFAISAADLLGLFKNSIKKGIAAITESDLRQRFIKLSNFTIFDDSYNSSFESVVADLKYMSSLDCPTGAFLGDILELGDKSESIHEQIGHEVVRYGIDHLYLYGKFAPHIAKGAFDEGMDFNSIFTNTDPENIQASIDLIMNNSSCGELILFKASHKLRFDKIIDLIAQKEGIFFGKQ